MRPAQLTPENDRAGHFVVHDHAASMRPAQLTPENRGSTSAAFGGPAGFNEAGAINAGKRVEKVYADRHRFDASMRPAQLTPENPAARSMFRCRTTCFNEAGAINAGKQNGSTI